jgi:DNA-binding NarL/FixJ family response regulator
LFAPTDPLIDVDFDSAAPDTLPPDTLPPDTLPPDEPPPKRALIASADLGVRLYLRAKLALAELPYADEAETGAQALELTRANDYAVALVDFELPDVNGWVFLKELKQARPAIAHVIVTKTQASLGERLRGWLGGAAAFYDNPPHPDKLHDLLQKV